MQIHFFSTEEYQFTRLERTQIQTIIEAAYSEATQSLPVLSQQLNILVEPSDSVIPEIGVSGTAMHKDMLGIRLNPDFDEGLNRVIDTYMKGQVIHEIHHCARYKLFDAEHTLLENAVLEGLATVFERYHADYAVVWGDYSDISIKAWTKKLLARQHETDFDYTQWFFGSSDGRRWIGYRVGAYIVDQALENRPEDTPATLVHISARDILRMAGF